jgi:valyl-tRNA synthetase
VLDVILKLLHPVMPFLTEELWQETADFGAARKDKPLLISADWPVLSPDLIKAEIESEIEFVIAAVSEGRSVRAELNVPVAARPALLVVEASSAQQGVLTANRAMIAQLLRISDVQFVQAAPGGAIPFVVEGATLALPVAGFIDLAAERARLTKEVASLASDIERTAKKLGNADFVARAPEEVVEENRERLAEAEATKAKLEAALARLTQAG